MVHFILLGYIKSLLSFGSWKLQEMFNINQYQMFHIDVSVVAIEG